MISNKILFITLSSCILVLNSFFILDVNNSTRYLTTTWLYLNSTSTLDNSNSSLLSYLKRQILEFSNESPSRINPHEYAYLINPEFGVCTRENQGENLTLLAFVLSSRNHFRHRELIRQTWSNRMLFPQMRVVFLLGSDLTSSDSQLEAQIRKENKKYGDLVQESFMDSYYNLTLKTVMGIKWVASYCSNVKYALKVDDDVIVNPYSLLPYLKNLTDQSSLQCFYHVNATIHRGNKSKFYVSYEELAAEHYEKYCDGPAYVFPGRLASSLFHTAQNTKHFKFEDVFFGQLAAKLKLKFTGLFSNYSREPNLNDEKLDWNELRKNKFYFYPCKQENFLPIWSQLSK